MRVIVFSIIALLVAIYVGVELQQDPGSVSVQFRGVTSEVTVPWAIAGLLVGFILLYLAVRVVSALLRSPRTLRRIRRRRRLETARRSLEKGLVQVAQGEWQRATKTLAPAMRHEQTAVLGCLASARAAQSLGNTTRRSELLGLAQSADPKASVAVGITEAQLLIQNQELDKAAHLLRDLRARDPRNRLVLDLLKECYLQSHAWRDLAELVPALERARVLKPDDANAMERNAYSQLLAQAAATGQDTRAMDEAWRAMPHGLRRQGAMVAQYARYLIEQGEGPRPESILRGKLKSEWNDELVYLYGLVSGSSAAQQLETAEGWLRRHPDDATLLLTLGRLALRNHLWGKARTYLERSAELDPRPETYMLLGKLLEQSGDKLIAGECFRKGLGITVNKNALLLERSPIELPSPNVAMSGNTAAFAAGGVA